MAFQDADKVANCVVATRARAHLFFSRRLSGFENPLPRTKVRGYTSDQSFSAAFKVRGWYRRLRLLGAWMRTVVDLGDLPDR
jgi:hypothetical protein